MPFKQVARSGGRRGTFSPFSNYFDPAGFAGRYVGPDLLRQLYVDESNRKKRLSLAYLSTIRGTTLKIDHTFWSTKHVREHSRILFGAQLGVVNEIGQIVATAFVNTKSLKDPAAMVREEKDNCATLFDIAHICR